MLYKISESRCEQFEVLDSCGGWDLCERYHVKVKGSGRSSDIRRIVACQWRRLRRWPHGIRTPRDYERATSAVLRLPARWFAT